MRVTFGTGMRFLMSPMVFIIICPIIGVFIIWAVRRVVRGANQRISAARSQVERAKVRIEAAEKTTAIAREQHKNMVGVAQQAMTQTGQALTVAGEITKVSEKVTTMSGQMDALIGFVAEELAALPRGRHAREPLPEHPGLSRESPKS